MNQNKTWNIYDMCMIGIFTAVISILAQISIPLPSGIPVTLQTFAITLAAILLGAKKGAIVTIIYLLLGATGIPVFTQLRGGLHVLVSATGGFLISFPVLAYLIGLGAEHKERKGYYPLMLISGTAFNYLIGMIVYCIYANVGILPAFFTCVLPFLPVNIITSILASILGIRLRKRLEQFIIS